MKRFILSLLLLSVLFTSFGQNAVPVQASSPKVDSIAEGLVLLALKGPQVKSSEKSAEAARYQYKATRTLWLNNISFMANVNEFSINQGSSSTDPLKQNTQYPRYNLGVVVPFGLFVNNSKQAKSAYNQFQSMEETANQQKQDMRRDVIITYQDYLMNLQLKDLQQAVVNDYKVIYQKTEERFKNGQTTLEQFNNASSIYNDALTKEITIKRDIGVVRATLEAMIGMDLDEAIALIKAGNVQK